MVAEITSRTVMFPILQDKVIRAIPWEAVAGHARQADANHGQTLNRLAERGGLSPCEAVAVIEDRKWQHMDQASARIKLMQLIADQPTT